MHHIVAPGFVDRPRRSDCTAGQMDGEAGWWTTSGNIGLPPLARAMGVGRQQQSKYNTKALFRLTRNMMGNSEETILPLHTCKRNMANGFSAFFYNKILNIRSELGLPGVYECGSVTNSFSGTPLTTFMDATELEIRNIIKLSPAMAG